MMTTLVVLEAFPDDTAPRWLVRDRDAIYSDVFRRRVASMGITEVIAAPSSPWQNPFAERLIGSLRRECLDHVIILNQGHLRCVLARYVSYDHRARTHLSLEKDAPAPRRIHAPTEGRVVAFAGGRWPAPSVRAPRRLTRRVAYHLAATVSDTRRLRPRTNKHTHHRSCRQMSS